MRRVKELMSMNDDIENSSLHSNFKDCRPVEGGQSLFTNSTIADSKKTKALKAGQQSSLAINKTAQERENAKRVL